MRQTTYEILHYDIYDSTVTCLHRQRWHANRWDMRYIHPILFRRIQPFPLALIVVVIFPLLAVRRHIFQAFLLADVLQGFIARPFRRIGTASRSKGNERET
ncbi:MAG: hypothetical protein A3H31_08210 [Gallionellales bacterium RIFCSPLOWO2_02_FULL_57_47]|nr:MAG: hypothetical protein A3H31_08210 [Gallionellales bacterium RIFCSPLOWO2_02_FULL_57_47]